MTNEGASPLRVLLADGHPESLELVAEVVVDLGHEVMAKVTNTALVASLSHVDPPDVAIVIVGESSEHALALLERIVREASCPVIMLLRTEDAAFIARAARIGVFAYVASGAIERAQLESAFAIVLHRFAEYHRLEGAFGRRALIERAKGILMERHSLDEAGAFALLRDQSRGSGRKLIDIASAVIDARGLLPSTLVETD